MSSLLMRVLVPTLVILGLAACVSDAKPAPLAEPSTAAIPVPVARASAEEVDEDEPTGKSLYMRHCAGCHNDNGDGRGATILAQGKQARSFAQGGFAFGNTPEAIFNTITSGIPGTSLMQPFKGVMDDDERRMVAEYVLTLTPYKAEAKSKASIMVVGDRAVFAYGKLPPIHEGLPERPRGLMVGLPGGLSFEYRVDDVRLLAVRRGGFVDREDWSDRGGGYLKPLGEVVFEADHGDPKPWILGLADSQDIPLELELVSTHRIAGVRGEQVEIVSKAKTPPDFGLRTVSVTCFQPHLSIPEAFGMRVEVGTSGGSKNIAVVVGSAPAESVVHRDLQVIVDAWDSNISELVQKTSDGFIYTYVKCLGPLTWHDDQLFWTPLDNGSELSMTATILVVSSKQWNDDIGRKFSGECESEVYR